MPSALLGLTQVGEEGVEVLLHHSRVRMLRPQAGDEDAQGSPH